MSVIRVDSVATQLSRRGAVTGSLPPDGLVLALSFPPESRAATTFAALAAELAARMPSSSTAAGYPMPSSTLHCTIATLRPFKARRRSATALEAELDTVWRPLLDEAAADAEWPSRPITLCWLRPQSLGATCTIARVDDVGGAVLAMRACIRRAIARQGGIAKEGVGSLDASTPCPVDGVAADSISHIPDIMHTSLLRWADANPAAEVVDGFRDDVLPDGAEVAFAAAVEACWPTSDDASGSARRMTVEATFDFVSLRVDRGYMHGDSHDVWRSDFAC